MANFIPTFTDTRRLTQAAVQNLAAKSLSFACLPGSVKGGPNPRWFLTGSPLAGHNGVVSAAFHPDNIEGAIAETLEPFQQRNLPLTWWTGPDTQPANLGAYLQKFGFTHNRDMIAMSAEIDRLAAPVTGVPALRLERVTSRALLENWLPLYLRGFNLPASSAAASLETLSTVSFRPDSGWRHYLARLNGQVAAISSLYISAAPQEDGSEIGGEKIAGLYNLAAHPDLRGQGIGAAMTLQTFALGQEEGCQLATLQTTYPNALRLYHRLGFEVYGKFGIYQRFP